MKQNGLKVHPWPANSSGSNPIEPMWHSLKRKMWRKWDKKQRKLHASVTSDDLENAVQDARDSIDASNLVTLVLSMPSRLDAGIKAKDGHTKCWKVQL